MKKEILIKNKKGDIIFKKIFLAQSYFHRMLGLMFQKGLKEYEGILIKPCNSVHTFFMKFSIDVIYLNGDFKIIKIYRQLAPWKITMLNFKTRQVLEVRGGDFPQEIQVGDQLEVSCIN